jgi:hypothetical protein
MTTQRPVTVSVVDPIGPAFEAVKIILFRPFDLGKWFIIGFCAWLAQLGSANGGGSGGGGGDGSRYNPAHGQFGQAKEYVLANLEWIVPLVIVGVVVGIALWFVFTWLSSRGQFMFLHCVAHNKAEVTNPWRKFRQHANSLFLFKIVVGLIGFFAIGLPLVFAIGFIIAMIANEGSIAIGVLLGLTAGIIVIGLGIIFALISKFTKDFVVPIMFLRATSCTEAWRKFLTILSVNKGRFILYILFHIVISIAIGTIVIIVALVTCCCAACILAIPYIGTVLFLPVLVFQRSYSLLYLRQYGPQFDVFAQAIENTNTV